MYIETDIVVSRGVIGYHCLIVLFADDDIRLANNFECFKFFDRP